MVEVMRAHDLLALSSMSATDLDDWLARDYDVESPVYLFVYPLDGRPNETHCCRWSVAWPVGPGSVTKHKITAWRHVQLESLADDLGSTVEMHYGYFGAITKTAGPEIVTARRYALGNTSLLHRKEIERLAHTTPVMDQVEGWSCQDWVKELLRRMAAAGVVPESECNDVISKACTCGA